MVICRVGRGQTCIISALSIMAGRPYTTEAVTETRVTALAIPAAEFRRLLAMSDRFRQFVFRSYHEEILSLMSVVDDLAFRRVDSRLAARLLAEASDDRPVRRTHQDLAVELGTAREVVSRQLKLFEQRGWLRASRGVIELLDPRALRETAEREAG